LIARRQIQEFLDQLASCCIIEKTSEGAYLIRPTEETLGDPSVLTGIYQQVKQRGGSWSPTANTFKLPPDARLPNDSAQRALRLLKGVFGCSDAEIRGSLRVLVEAGMGVEEISSVTGASRATVYRYLRQRPNQSQNETP
jgi:DNA-binding phage protein